MIFLLLAGCAKDDSLDRAMTARSEFQRAACRFRATVSADYGDLIHTFVLECHGDRQGNVDFSVAAPETIADITGTLTGDSGFLTFDNELLAFELLADGQLSPVSAPWILLHTLRSGYLRSCGAWEKGIRLTIDDSYAENAMQVDIWMNDHMDPVAAEILWQGRRILSMKVENFEFVEQSDAPRIG